MQQSAWTAAKVYCPKAVHRKSFAARLSQAIISALLASSVAASSIAAVYTYTPTNSSNNLWSLGTNWSAVPVGNSDTELSFVGSNGSVLSDGLTNANTNDIPGAFFLNVLDLQGTGPSGSPAVINIGGSAAGNYLVFVGSNGVANLNAMAGIAGLTYDVQSNIKLAANNTTFQGDGTAKFIFSGTISGSKGMTKAGVSTVILSGTNTYTGDTKCNGGILQLGSEGALSRTTLDYSNYGGEVSFVHLAMRRLED